MATQQQRLVSLGIARASDIQWPVPVRQQFQFERIDDLAGDLVLDRKDIFEAAVVGVRPQVRAVGCAYQLRGDADLVAGLAHAAFKHVVHR